MYLSDGLLVAITGVLFVLLIIRKLSILSSQHTSSSDLPHLPYTIPYVGSAARYGWNHIEFFTKYSDRCGPNFRALVGGMSFVFVSSQAALDVLYRNRHRKLTAVRIFRRHGLGNIQSEHFPDILAQSFVPVVIKVNTTSYLQPLTPGFNRSLADSLANAHAAGKPLSLRHLVFRSIFTSFTPAMLGRSFPLEIYDDMVTVDDNSYSLFSPAMSFFAFATQAAQRRIKSRIIDFMEPWRITDGKEDMFGVSEPGNVLCRALVSSKLPAGDQAGTLQAYLWGVYTNVVRFPFWLIVHLFSDRAAYARLQYAIDNAVRELFPNERDLLDADPSTLSDPRFAMLDSALKEVGRLYVLPSSYRTVEEDIEFPDATGKGSFWVRKGEMVCANVTRLHMNAQVFDEPSTFRLDRFADGETDHSQRLFIFGKGAHMCSGKHTANYLMKMFMIFLLRYYDIVPAEGYEGFERPSPIQRSLSSMAPDRDVDVRLVRRQTKQ